MGEDKMVDYITTVRLLERESRRPLGNVKVELFDRDEHSPDDSLGVARTNKFGEATFRYSTRDFADSPLGGDDSRIKLRNQDTVPDLYPVVYNGVGEVVISKRDEATQNNAALHILVLIDAALVQQHQLNAEA